MAQMIKLIFIKHLVYICKFNLLVHFDSHCSTACEVDTVVKASDTAYDKSAQDYCNTDNIVNLSVSEHMEELLDVEAC